MSSAALAMAIIGHMKSSCGVSNGRCQEPAEADREKLDHLKKCVASLGENLRRYVTWRYDGGIPLEEMAARTGRSIGAIKKQLWQIRRKLQE